MIRQRGVVVNQKLGDISSGLCHCTEQWRAFDPPHLHRRRDDYPRWLPGGLGQYIRKVETVCTTDNQAPKTVADVELAEQDVEARVGIVHELQ
jgi:hypothetical protein